MANLDDSLYLSMETSPTLKAMYNGGTDPILPDVDLWVEGADSGYEAHRCVLAAATPFFRQLFTSGFKEIVDGKVWLSKKEVCHRSLGLVLRVIYGEEISVTCEDLYALHATANFLQVSDLADDSVDHILENVRLENVTRSWKYANRQFTGSGDILARCNAFIWENLTAVSERLEFLGLKWVEISSMITAIKEDSSRADYWVLKTVMKWLNHDWSNRYLHIDAVLVAVDWSKIQHHEMLSLLQSFDLFDRESSECSTDQAMLKLSKKVLSSLKKSSTIRGSSPDEPICGESMPQRLYLVSRLEDPDDGITESEYMVHVANPVASTETDYLADFAVDGTILTGTFLADSLLLVSVARSRGSFLLTGIRVTGDDVTSWPLPIMIDFTEGVDLEAAANGQHLCILLVNRAAKVQDLFLFTLGIDIGTGGLSTSLALRVNLSSMNADLHAAPFNLAVLGGIPVLFGNQFIKILDATTKELRDGATIPKVVSKMAAYTAFGNRLYAAGKYDPTKNQTPMLVYDVADNAWSELPTVSGLLEKIGSRVVICANRLMDLPGEKAGASYHAAVMELASREDGWSQMPHLDNVRPVMVIAGD